MTNNQLMRLKAGARTAFIMYETRLFEILQEGEAADFAEVAVRFIDVHFLYEEIKAFHRDYIAIWEGLTNYLAGKPYWGRMYSEDDAPTIWEFCLLKLEAEGDKYHLIQPSNAFKVFVESHYDRERAMQTAFDRFVPSIPKATVVNNELVTLTPDQEAQINLNRDLSNLELSFSGEALEGRMKRAQLLCEQQAGPAEILKLFS